MFFWPSSKRQNRPFWTTIAKKTRLGFTCFVESAPTSFLTKTQRRNPRSCWWACEGFEIVVRSLGCRRFLIGSMKSMTPFRSPFFSIFPKASSMKETLFDALWRIYHRCIFALCLQPFFCGSKISDCSSHFCWKQVHWGLRSAKINNPCSDNFCSSKKISNI